MCHFPEVIYHMQKKFISLKVNNAESVLVTYNMLHIHCHKFGWTLHVRQPLQHRCTQQFHQLWHLKWNKLGELATCRPPATYESHKHTDCKYWFDYTNTPGTHFKHFLRAAASCNFESMLLGTIFLYCSVDPTLELEVHFSFIMYI